VEHLRRFNPIKQRHTPILLFQVRVLRNSCLHHTHLCQPRIVALQYLYIRHPAGIQEDLSHLTCQVDTKILQLVRRILETFLSTPWTTRI
jgi:hypothetical protein